jgi:hypothetical protein
MGPSPEGSLSSPRPLPPRPGACCHVRLGGGVTDREDPEKDWRPEIYVPYGHYTAYRYSLVVRAAPETVGVLEKVKAEIKSIDEQLVITGVQR